jgi:hypothetical protein
MAAVTAAVPTLSQMQAWSTGHLESAANHWTQTAEDWEHAFTAIHRETPTPGGTPWRGVAADAAVLRTGSDRVVVVGAADSLHSAALAARSGAGEIEGARQLALEAVEDARTAGFTVGEDLSVTSQVGGPPALQAARQVQAQTLAAAIRASAENLASVDTEVAGNVSSAIAGVNSVQFGDTPVAPQNKKPQIQAVDFKQDPPPPPPPGPNANDIRGVLDKLPVGDSSEIRVVKSQQDLDNLWNWLKQNGVERLPGYGNKPGDMVTLPDGTIIGRRVAADSTGQPAIDVRVPGGKDGYIKVHINPTEGGVPEIPKVGEPVAPKPPPVEPLPKPGGIPIFGGPGTPIGPTFVPPPHSIRHIPIIGEDDPDAPWEYEP